MWNGLRGIIQIMKKIEKGGWEVLRSNPTGLSIAS